MYNFDHQHIPLLLPISEGSQLQPWFPTAILDAGLQLIREKRISDFSCIRTIVSALIDKKATVSLQFDKSTTLRQGFFIPTRHCGLCRLKTDEKGCAHMAALAILSLIIPPGQTKAIPIPLAFAGSNWQKIGDFLHAWLHKTQYKAHRISSSDGISLLRIDAAGGQLEVTLSDSWYDQGDYLLHRQRGADDKKTKGGIALLFDQLRLQSMTANERALEKAGAGSIGWQKDCSFSTWLARMLFIFHGDITPDLQKNPSTSGFILQIGDKNMMGALTLMPPREKTWEVVRAIPLTSPAAKILPAAKECYRVFFNKEGLLEISPCLRLADGRLLARSNLAEARYSSAYYLEGEGFLPTIRMPAEGTFINPAANPSPLPLLGFLQNEKSRHESFTVAVGDIPAFLKA